MVEQHPVKVKVDGSSPSVRAIYSCRLIGRTSAFGADYWGSSPYESAIYRIVKIAIAF